MILKYREFLVQASLLADLRVIEVTHKRNWLQKITCCLKNTCQEGIEKRLIWNKLDVLKTSEIYFALNYFKEKSKKCSYLVS